MEELLKKLLETEVLNEETKVELEAAIKTQLDEAVEAAKAEATADIRAELTEQWVTERDALIEAVDAKVTEFLAAEISELKEDIDRFRDLEAEHAEKLVEAKAQMADELKGDLGELVEKIDAFLEIRLTSELEELREDIDDQKKNDFGRRIFEAVADEFKSLYSDEESAEASLRETETRLEDTAKALEESERRVAKMEREQKLDEVLSPLDGRQREVMGAILKSVDTKNLEEGYNTFIGRVLRETEGDAKEKEETVLAESETKTTEELKETTVAKSGDTVLTEEEKAADEEHKLSADKLANLRKLAGIGS